ncbi:MAG: ComEC/Rec2 family competence protein, partial [bacterium]|nr:ComEC/Rec2 family competence protein [bacterium]
LIIFHPSSSPVADGRLTIEFLDVGQGDSTFITFPNGETMLIDGGGRVDYSVRSEEDEPFEPDAPRIGEMVVSEFLWEKGYSRVDRLVVSHADADHSQGLTDTIRNFSVGEVILGSAPATDSEMDGLLTLAKLFSVPVRQVGRGESIHVGGAVRIDMLWPLPTSEPLGSDNNSSLVMRLIHGTNTFLFTGDIEQEAEAGLLAEGSVLRADVIKVPHHGSRTSSTKEFVDAVRPKLAIIPVGNRSMFGHPHLEVVERWRAAGAETRTTGRKGTLTVLSDGNSLDFTTFLP